MNKLTIVLLASLASSLTACSSVNDFTQDVFTSSEAQSAKAESLNAQLRSETTQVTALNELTFQLLSVKDANKIAITADSPIVRFQEGNAFTRALLLPENISEFTFVLESRLSHTVFVPSVIFLNEQLQQVGQIEEAKFNAKGFYSIDKILLADSAAAIRYILVFSRDSVLDGETEILDPAREYQESKGQELPLNSFPVRYAKHSPIGKVNIRLQDVSFNATTPSTVKATSAAVIPVILADTEAFYLQQISKAIKEGDVSRAYSFVVEAERAGSAKARPHYQAELDKQQ